MGVRVSVHVLPRVALFAVREIELGGTLGECWRPDRSDALGRPWYEARTPAAAGELGGQQQQAAGRAAQARVSLAFAYR